MEFRRLARSYNPTCGGRVLYELEANLVRDASFVYSSPKNLSHSFVLPSSISLTCSNGRPGKAAAVSGWQRLVAPVYALPTASGVAESFHSTSVKPTRTQIICVGERTNDSPTSNEDLCVGETLQRKGSLDALPGVGGWSTLRCDEFPPLPASPSPPKSSTEANHPAPMYGSNIFAPRPQARATSHSVGVASPDSRSKVRAHCWSFPRRVWHCTRIASDVLVTSTGEQRRGGRRHQSDTGRASGTLDTFPRHSHSGQVWNSQTLVFIFNFIYLFFFLYCGLILNLEVFYEIFGGPRLLQLVCVRQYRLAVTR